jgi:hypothetical protein
MTAELGSQGDPRYALVYEESLRAITTQETSVIWWHDGRHGEQSLTAAQGTATAAAAARGARPDEARAPGRTSAVRDVANSATSGLTYPRQESTCASGFVVPFSLPASHNRGGVIDPDGTAVMLFRHG